MRFIVASLFLALSFMLFAQSDMKTNTGSHSDVLRTAERLIIVTTSGWNVVDGSMQRFEKRNGRWTKVGEAVPVVVGEKGMGWDPVLSHPTDASAPTKHEGDGRSPAGVFEVGTVFGFADDGPTTRDYIPLTSTTECVDDVKSEHYAHVVDRNKVANMDWNSSEKMREIGVYKLGMVVNYNLANTVPGNGSCIFLHIWKGPGHGTAGCTAMDEARLQELVNWIGDRKAALVQMPTAEYERIKKALALP